MLLDEATKTAMESGRLLVVFHINEVHQLNPNATHVTNNYYGEEFMPNEAMQKPASHATRNPQLSKDSVLEYVMRLYPPMCARSGKTSTGRCGGTSSNCLPW